MNTERDELERLMAEGFADDPYAIADAILAAGYRKPREVTTPAELDALPVGSVVLDGWGTAYQKEADDDGDTYWSCFEGIIYHFKTFHGPVTLLHEGPAA